MPALIHARGAGMGTVLCQLRSVHTTAAGGAEGKAAAGTQFSVSLAPRGASGAATPADGGGGAERAPSAAVLRLRQKADALRAKSAVTSSSGGGGSGGSGSGPAGGSNHHQNRSEDQRAGAGGGGRSGHRNHHSHQQQRRDSKEGAQKEGCGHNGSAFMGEDRERSYSRVERLFGPPKYDEDGRIVADLDPSHLQSRMDDYHLTHLR